MNEFVIDFRYDQVPYSALVVPRQEEGETIYTVKAESQNQEFYLDIVANPCGEDKMEWCFKGTPSESENYDPALLQEIGEAIEKYQSENL
jgi:hypothetical protein